MTSASATPTFDGPPSAGPVIAIHPRSAWITKSYPGRALSGPKPVIVHQTSWRRRTTHSSGARPSFSSEPGREIVHDHIGAVDEMLDEFAIRGSAEVGGDAELVAIDAEEIRALAARIEGRSPPARLVARAGALDLDDVGAKITEHHRRERSGEDSRHI